MGKIYVENLRGKLTGEIYRENFQGKCIFMGKNINENLW
jgi:hypothetical protein